MPKIIDVIRAKRKANVTAGFEGDHSGAQETGRLARLAAIGGIGSDGWKEYMKHFGDLTPDQLKRLNAEDDTKDSDAHNFRRAYLVANGVCGMSSPDTMFIGNKADTIDEDPPVDDVLSPAAADPKK